MASGSERRRHIRLPIKTQVYVSGDTFDRFITKTMDFSDGGLFIEAKQLAGLMIETVIFVQSAELGEDAPILKARIAWTNRYGAGIEYLDI